MNLVYQYWQEMLGHEVIERDWGFARVSVDSGILTVHDLFISPTNRKAHNLKSMGDMILERANERGCETVIAYIEIASRNVEQRMAMLLRWKMSPLKTDASGVYFIRRVHG